MNKKCPLTGEECDKHKYFHVTELNNGEHKEFSLCTECVVQYHSKIQKIVKKSVEDNHDKLQEMEKSVEDNSTEAKKKKKDFDPAELMKLLISPPKGLEIIPQISNKNCRNCGMNLGQFASNGRIGCPKCYEYLSKGLKPILIRAHGAVKHVGKIPKNWAKNKKMAELTFDHISDKIERVSKMKEKMMAVIKEERYEDAAIIKKKIEEITSDSASNPPTSVDQ